MNFQAANFRSFWREREAPTEVCSVFCLLGRWISILQCCCRTLYLTIALYWRRKNKTTMYNRFSLFFVCPALRCVYTISNPVLLWMLCRRNAFLQVAGISGPSQQHACHTIQTLSQTRESGLVLVHMDLCQ